MAEARPPIPQLVLAGFAALAVAFSGVATVVAVTTGPDEPNRQAPAPRSLVERGSASRPVAALPADASTGARWSTVRVAQEIGVRRQAHLAHS